MSKILESLPLTVVAGVVLTVIMIFAINYIEDQQSPANKAKSELDKMMK